MTVHVSILQDFLSDSKYLMCSVRQKAETDRERERKSEHDEGIEKEGETGYKDATNIYECILNKIMGYRNAACINTFFFIRQVIHRLHI